MLPPKPKKYHRRNTNTRNMEGLIEDEKSYMYNTMPSPHPSRPKYSLDDQNPVNPHLTPFYHKPTKSALSPGDPQNLNLLHSQYHSPFTSNSLSTFVTEADHDRTVRELKERICGLEKLVWKVYGELDHRMMRESRTGKERVQEVREEMERMVDYFKYHLTTSKTSKTSQNSSPSLHPSDPHLNSSSESPQTLDNQEEQDIQNNQESQEEITLLGHLSSVIEEESSEAESEKNQLKSFYRSGQGDERVKGGFGDDEEVEGDEEAEGENPEFYYSCHEKMVNDGEESLLQDPRDIITMPNLSRSTLMDEIDYSLANLKISEFSDADQLVEQIKDLKKYNSNFETKKEVLDRTKSLSNTESAHNANISETIPLSKKVFKYNLNCDSL